MADIFGKELHDYSHIRRMRESGEGLWERHQDALIQQRSAVGTRTRRHDFGALRVRQVNDRSAAEPVGYLTNNLLAIQSMADEILYTEHRLPSLVPLNTSIPEGATSYGVKITDWRGESNYIANDGTDAENVVVSQTLDTQPLDYAGVDASWSVQDLRESQFAGVPLSTDTLRFAVRACQNKMETVALKGDDARGTKGLTNLSSSGTDGVTETNASATFASSTGEAIRGMINDEISKLISDSKEVVGGTLRSGLCVYLDVVNFDRVMTTPLGDNADKTIGEFLTMNNAFTARTGNPIMFKSLQELDGAAGSSQERMITTLMDTQVFEMGVSIMPRVISVVDKGRMICAPVEHAFSPLYVKRPDLIRYLDNV